MAKDNTNQDTSAEDRKAAEAAAKPASTNNIPDNQKCPDCDGRGIRNPDVDHQVCPTCEGSGRVR